VIVVVIAMMNDNYTSLSCCLTRKCYHATH
jgi:hypothetical protein